MKLNKWATNGALYCFAAGSAFSNGMHHASEGAVAWTVFWLIFSAICGGLSHSALVQSQMHSGDERSS